jgi:hypothetical protein
MEFHAPPSLQLFAIVDPTIPLRSEDAKEMKKQILYYYPYHSLEQQTKQVGLYIGLSQFTLLFDSQIHIIKSLKSKVIIRKHNDHLIICKIRLPVDVLQQGTKKYANYHDIKDSILSDFMEQMYQRFLLLDQPLDDLSVVDYYTHIHLGLLNVIPAMFAAPFDDKVHRSIVSIVTRLQTQIPMFQLCVFYKNSLAWTSLEDVQNTLYLYQYITNRETGKFYDGFINQVKPKGQPVVTQRLFQPSRNELCYSGFLVGPTLQELRSQHPIIPKCISLGGLKHCLIVYQLQEVFTLCFVTTEVGSTFLTQSVWYQYLQNTILDSFKNTEIYESRPLTSYTYVTFNRMTLKLKSWFKKNPNCFDFLHDEFQRYNFLTRELMIKSKEGWICAIKTHDRDIYVLIEQDCDVGVLQGISF